MRLVALLIKALKIYFTFVYVDHIQQIIAIFIVNELHVINNKYVPLVLSALIYQCIVICKIDMITVQYILLNISLFYLNS